MNLLLANIHGHILLLAVALCFHPWTALRKATRPAFGTRLTAYLAASLMFAGNALGWYIYPDYRIEVKRHLYLYSEAAGLGFEVKEHFAFFAVVLSIAGAYAAFVSASQRHPSLTAIIRLSFAAAAVLGTIAVALGIWVASLRGFAYPEAP
jgi:hypothetical protein